MQRTQIIHLPLYFLQNRFYPVNVHDPRWLMLLVVLLLIEIRHLDTVIATVTFLLVCFRDNFVHYFPQLKDVRFQRQILFCCFIVSMLIIFDFIRSFPNMVSFRCLPRNIIQIIVYNYKTINNDTMSDRG